MSNVIKKVKEITIGEEEFILTADMRTIAKFKELTGKSFLESVNRLATMDDEIIIQLVACTLRRKDTPNQVMGQELLDNYNPFTILLNCGEDVAHIISESIPKAKGNSEKK